MTIHRPQGSKGECVEASSRARPGLGERRAGARKALSTSCRIQLIWHVQNRHTYRDRKKISGCIRMQEADRNWKVGGRGQEGGGGEPLKVGTGWRSFFLECWKCSKVTVVMTVQLCEHIKNHWLVPLIWWVVQYLSQQVVIPQKIIGCLKQSSNNVWQGL